MNGLLNLAAFVIVLGLVLGLNFCLGAILITYVINSWLVFAGKAAVIVWWQGGLIGLVPLFGQLAIPAAVITYIAMMFFV